MYIIYIYVCVCVGPVNLTYDLVQTYLWTCYLHIYPTMKRHTHRYIHIWIYAFMPASFCIYFVSMRAFADSSLDNFAVHLWFSGRIQSMAPPCSTRCEGRNRNGRQSCGCWPTLPLPRLALGLVAQRAWTATSWGVRCDIGLGQEMSRDVKRCQEWFSVQPMSLCLK